jgi:hypothetical protein
MSGLELEVAGGSWLVSTIPSNKPRRICLIPAEAAACAGVSHDRCLGTRIFRFSQGAHRCRHQRKSDRILCDTSPLAVDLRTEKKVSRLEVNMNEVAEIARVDPIVHLDGAAEIAIAREAQDESAKAKNIANIVRGAQT